MHGGMCSVVQSLMRGVMRRVVRRLRRRVTPEVFRRVTHMPTHRVNRLSNVAAAAARNATHPAMADFRLDSRLDSRVESSLPSVNAGATASPCTASDFTGSPRRRMLLGGLVLGAAAPLLAACGSRPAPVRQLDFGQAPVWPAGTVLPRRVDIQAVSTSELTRGTAVAYRLDDTDPYTRRSYRDSRWAAPLSTLMGDRLKQLNARAVLAAGAEPLPPVAILVEVEDCVQRFSSPTQSEVTLRVGASTGRQRRLFEASAPAGGDAEGGARAMAQLLDRLGVEMLSWAAALGPSTGKA